MVTTTTVYLLPPSLPQSIIERRFGYTDGLMGGNLWFLGKDEEAALRAAERAMTAIQEVVRLIMPFPGGITSSGSKAGSRYAFSIASTYEKFCPPLQEKLGEKPGIPKDVGSMMQPAA